MAGRIVLLAAAAALLVACSGESILGGPPGPDPQVPPSGSAAFQEGYLDGCPTGFGEAGREGYEYVARLDAKRYSLDPEYKHGFDQGRSACYEYERSHPTMTNESSR